MSIKVPARNMTENWQLPMATLKRADVATALCAVRTSCLSVICQKLPIADTDICRVLAIYRSCQH